MTIILSKTTQGKFQNTFKNSFSSQYVLFQAKKWVTKSHTKLADDVPLSIRSNETRFRNVFYLFFHINLSL